jgi:hypothetical protein
LPFLNKLEKYTEKLTFVIDMEYGEFRLDVLELLEDLFLNHYPGRLNRIFIIKINLDNITGEV